MNYLLLPQGLLLQVLLLVLCGTAAEVIRVIMACMLEEGVAVVFIDDTCIPPMAGLLCTISIIIIIIIIISTSFPLITTHRFQKTTR